MDHQQAINFDIFAKFAELDIRFAIPTQKVLMSGNAGAPALPLGSS
jgi:hypothetical protein